MSSAAVNPVREGFHTITPYLIVQRVLELIDFVTEVFEAEETLRGTGGAGGIHSELRVGDSMLMVGGGEALKQNQMPSALHVYVDDVDAIYERALAAGAQTLNWDAYSGAAGAPTDHPYGERGATVQDMCGNRWYLATPIPRGTPRKAGFRTVTPYLHPDGAAKLIDFLKRTLSAKEVGRYTTADGATIMHAELLIGDSMLELSEAHGPYQNMPTTFYLYVTDADAMYEHAVSAGAKSVMPPADQPFGDRLAAIADPVGNLWYIATHMRDTAV
jgi:uncharacterized glyoxalase superfamily protein PhnB